MNPRTVSVAEGLLVLCVGPFVAAACLTWWLLGNLDESPTAEDQLFSAEFADESSLIIGVIGLLAATTVAVALRGWPQPWRTPVSAPLALSGVSGAYLGLFLRTATAKVTGANIGGGILILVSPVILVVLARAVSRVVRLVHGLQASAR